MQAAADRHRNKRPFQPQITSFFAPQIDDEDDSDEFEYSSRTQPQRTRLRLTNTTHHHVRQHETLAPQVPGHIQANLLSVGMRVRKSVPEGYKTSNTKMTSLPSIQTTLTTNPTLDVKPPRDPVPEDSLHQRELLPFCGLHKIGGLGFAEQPTTNIHLYAGIDNNTGTRASNLFPLPAEAFSQPFSSQDSGYASDLPPSTTTHRNPLNPSKRSWHDEESSTAAVPLSTNFFFGNARNRVRVDDVPVSPLSESPPEGFGGRSATRAIATPKSRRPNVLRTGSEDSMDTDMSFEESGGPGDAGEAGADFEDAGFLEREVCMGGV